jgi:hypothetical protein
MKNCQAVTQQLFPENQVSKVCVCVRALAQWCVSACVCMCAHVHAHVCEHISFKTLFLFLNLIIYFRHLGFYTFYKKLPGAAVSPPHLALLINMHYMLANQGNNHGQGTILDYTCQFWLPTRLETEKWTKLNRRMLYL